jgi:CheY-like chemotaxis protein
VLVIDDDVGTRETFDWALSPLGVRVHTAACGTEGIRIAESARFDLLLVDFQLPDMRGTDVVRALQGNLDTPVTFILVSAFLTTQITVEAMKLGAANVLEKPITIDDLPGLVWSAVRQPGRSRRSTLFTESPRDVTTRPAIQLQETSRPGSAAERWAMHVMKGCHSASDLKTLEQWAICAGVSYSSLRESCRLVGMRPYDARDLVRVLRAVILASRAGCPPAVLLDVSDRRTLGSLLERSGLESASDARSMSVDQFFRYQRFVCSDNAALHVLRAMLTARMSLS